MKHESNDVKETIIRDISLSFEDIYLKPYTPKSNIDEIKKADILLIPYEGYRETKGYFFPECTDEFFRFLKNYDEELLVDICISDDEYQTLELHSDLINLAMLIIPSASWTIVINMVSAYLYDAVKKLNRSANEINVNFKTISENDGKSKEVNYSGTIENFERAMKALEKDLQ